MKNILKDVLWDFLLKLSMHKKNIPGDEMETFVEKNRFLSNNIPLLFMNFLTNCLFKQPFSDPFTFLLFFFLFTTYIGLQVRWIVLNGSWGTCKAWMEEN